MMKQSNLLFAMLFFVVHSAVAQQHFDSTGTSIPALLDKVMKHQRTQDSSLGEYTSNFRSTLKISKWWKGKVEDITIGESFQSWRRNVDVVLAHNGEQLSPEKIERERQIDLKALQSDMDSWDMRAADKKSNELEYGSQRGSFYMSMYSIFRDSDFSNPRKGVLDGREMDVFDFSPRPGFKAHDTNDAPLAHLRGTVWIDADDKITAKIIALAVPSSQGDDVVFEQRFSRMPEGVWLQTYLRMNPSTNPKFFNGENFDWIRENYGYQRFTVDATPISQ